MPKKIKFESFKYRFLISAQDASQGVAAPGQPAWEDFIKSLAFSYDKGTARVAWRGARAGETSFSLDEPKFYRRGDGRQQAERQSDGEINNALDPVKQSNEAYFANAVRRVAEAAGYQLSGALEDGRLQKERAFHDDWANSSDAEKIDVRTANEACTAPEMRYIVKRLGDMRGKKLLDVGCGLGEASVYFALLGAKVTSSDLSQGMLDATSRLAQANGVSVIPHLSAAEDLRLPAEEKFDVIYAGNLLHHVDIDQTLTRLKPHLAPEGLLVTWDPLAYNPAINVYRTMATDVRTPDEHPLKWSDIKLFRTHFSQVDTRYFWLLTLVIFLIMALVQRRDPNKERFWKVVVQEGEKWRWLYRPLELAERVFLWLFPPLRLMCWNVVIVAKGPL